MRKPNALSTVLVDFVPPSQHIWVEEPDGCCVYSGIAGEMKLFLAKRYTVKTMQAETLRDPEGATLVFVAEEIREED